MSDRSSVLQTRTVRAAHPLAERDEPSPVDSDITRPIAVQTVFQDIAKTFDMQSRRDTFKGDARISATDNLDFTLGLNTYQKTGNVPCG